MSRNLLLSLLVIVTGAGSLWFLSGKNLDVGNHPSNQKESTREAAGVANSTSLPSSLVRKEVSSTRIINKTDSQNVAEFVEKLKQWINEFPFSQENTNSTNNSPEITQELVKLSDKIVNGIINNPSLSHQEKASILWDVYFNTSWSGSDNAVQSILMARLSELIPYELSEDIFVGYQSMLSQGENTRGVRHDLLQITDGILGLDASSLSVKEKNIYDDKSPYLKELLMQQITSIPASAEELGDLHGYSVRLYANYADKHDVDKLMSGLQSSIFQNPEHSGEFYHAIFTNFLSSSALNSSSLSLLLTSSPSAKTQQEMNKTLAFLLKEDGNLALSDIGSPIKQELLGYLKSQQNNIQGSDLERDWKMAISRLQ